MKKNKKESKRKEHGITLIALVITIIVLLILAGVSIAMLTGENGILSRVQNASRETGEASVIEQARLDILAKQTEESGRTIYKEELKEILDEYFETVPDNYTLDTELQTKNEYGDYQIKVSEIYNGELIEGPIFAKDVLIPNENGTTAEEKSPYVMYNNILCRVLYNDETHGLQIVSDDNIEGGNVTLGYGDPTVTAEDFTYDGTATVSENFKKAAASYNNAVDTLNKKAEDYMGTKAIDARSIGSIATLNGEGKFQGDTSGMFTGTETYLETYAWNGKFKDADTNYTEDVKQIIALELNATSTTWLASRDVISGSSNTYFIVRILYAAGNTASGNLCYVAFIGSTSSISHAFGFRPVFLLSSDIIISSGDGSEGNPYVIE